jgi:enoyl-CoA hydratase/carnithine racemase
MSGSLKSTSEGSTLILTLSNPEYKNALGPDMYAAGIEALNAAENNREIRSVVIAGEDAVFCAGGNLQRLQANRRESPEVQAQSIEALHNWIDAIRTYPKPVIAAVEGAAAGAGFSLALACELLMGAARISAERLHELGLVNRVTAAGGALSEALVLAARLNARAPNALASIKELINDAPTNTMSQQMDSERNHFVRNLHHANGGEGIDAFLQKRKPQYR